MMLANATNRRIIVSLLFLIFASSCSGSLNPVTPLDNPALPMENSGALEDSRESVIEENGDADRILWGIWSISFDLDEMTVDIIYAREAMAHYDITDHVLPPECSNCFELNVLGFDTVARILEAEVTLRNPFQISGRDVRGILYTNDYGHGLVNPDDWTGLWDAPGGSNINPFRAFAKDEPNRAFGPGQEHVEIYAVYIPVPPAYQMITFAVDASWPGNCKEPFEIVDFVQDGELFNQVGSHVPVNVRVHDWQEDVSKVTLVAPDITGESFTSFNHEMDDIWSLDLINNEGAAAGEYRVRIIADSTGSPGVPLYDYVQIVVSEAPIINVISINPYSGNAGYEYAGVEVNGEGFVAPAWVFLQRTGQEDIPTGNVDVIDPGLLTFDFGIPLTAELGTWDVKVVIDGGAFGIGSELFQISAVTPSVTAIDPDNAYPNQGIAGATIFGGWFQGPGAQVKLKKTGQPDVEAENVVVVDENHITCDLHIPFAAAQGLWDIEVINGTGMSGTGAGLFDVIPQIPVIHYTNPNSAYAGTQLFDVNIEGNHFQGPPGAAVVLKMPGTSDIVGKNVAVLAQETISFDVNIPYDAKPGYYDVDVISGYGLSGVGIDVFEILEPIPNSPIEITPDWLNWSPQEVDIELGKAYVTGGYNGLHIFDLADPENPVWKSKIGTHEFATDVCAYGDYAYVSDSAKGLYVFDISVPGAPAYVNHLVLSNYPQGIDYDTGYIYLTDTQDLLIIDVNPPGSAYVEKTVPIVSSSVYPVNVKYRDGYAYVCCGEDGLHIVDVDPISTASIVASIPSNSTSGYGGIIDLTFQGDYAYVCDASYGVLVVDIYSPLSPSQVHYVSSYARGIDLIEGEDYVCVGSGGWMQFIDITTPTSAFTAYSVPCGGDAPGSPVVNGDYVYMPDRGTHLRIYDITDPDNAFETNSLRTPGFGQEVTFDNDFAYVPCFAAGLMLVDCADPFAARCVNSVDTWEAMSCAVSDGYAYVRDNEEGLRIMDVDPPGSAYIVNSVVPGFGIHSKLDYANGYVYATSWTDGMYVIDVDPPGSASTINTLTTTDTYNDVCVVGSYGYIASYNEGVNIVDISIPGSESVIKTAAVAGDNPVGIYVDGGYAYVIGNEFHIMDIDPPSGAAVVKTVTVPGILTDVVTQGGFAYVTSYDGGTSEKKLYIIDIWPVGSADIYGSIDLWEFPHGVDINGNILYVAELSGLRIYQLW